MALARGQHWPGPEGQGQVEDVPGLEFPSRPSQTRTPSHPLTNGSQRSHDFFFNFLKAHLHRDALIPRDTQLGSLLRLPSSCMFFVFPYRLS